MMDKIEGGPGFKLRNLIQRVGANTDTRIEFGTVTAAAPSLRVLVDGMKFEIDTGDCVVSERLTDHTVEARLNGAADPVMIEMKSGLQVGERVIVAEINNGQTFVILDRIGRSEAI